MPRRIDGTVLVVGESLIDIVQVRGQSGATEYVGGSPANVAFGVAALGHLTELQTWFGRDERGDRIVETCRRSWVHIGRGSDSAVRTPVARALVDEDGVATYEFDLTWDVPGQAEADVSRASHVHTGSFAATLEPGARRVLEIVRTARAAGSTVSYDLNARPSIMGDAADVLPQMEAIIEQADVVKASDEDVAWLYPQLTVPEVLRRWGEISPGLAVITRGGQDAVVGLSAGDLSSNGGERAAGELMTQRVPAVEVVDTVGAGDSFMAGLLSGLLDSELIGRPGARERLLSVPIAQLRVALERAAACAAVTVTHAGAYAPSRADLQRPMIER